MRFKRYFIKGLPFALIFTLIPVTAFSAQKVTPGSTCKVLNQKVVYLNKTHTCIKSGRKLIWNHGVEILKTMPIPAPTPSSAKIPIPTQAGITDPREFILASAINKVKNFRNSHNTLVTDMRIESDFNPEAQSSALEAQSKTVSIFGDFFPTGARLSLVLSNSYSFVVASLKELGGSDSWISTQIPLLKSAYPEAVAIKRPIWAFGAYLNGDRSRPIIVYLSFPGYKFELNASEVGAHELFHLVQELLDSGSGNLPCWIHEGQASIIGTALSTQSNSEEKLIALIKNDDRAHSAGADLGKIEAPFGWQNNGHGPCGDVGEYQQGRIANALLIDKFGVAKNLEFLQALNGLPGDGTSWKTVFFNVFQIKTEDFYSEANAYIKWFFKRYFSQDL